MGKEWCVDGQLVATSYTSPLPYIGLNIASFTSVCFFLMTLDLVYGFFNPKNIGKKPFSPCKFFPLNASILTLLTIATTIPNDLVTQMPRAEDQLSKLTATALLCTSIGLSMPSQGTMGTSELYQNLGGLALLVYTVALSVSTQMHTGLIFAFKIEHFIIIGCLFVLLLVSWSSPVAIREQRNNKKGSVDRDKVKDLDGLRGLINRAYEFNYQYNGQTLLCKSPNHHTFGLLCILSLVVVSQPMVRYCFFPTSIKSCGTTASDYKWSIPIVIVTQFVTIVVGSIPIIHRWFSLLRHVDKISLEVRSPQLELENLKSLALPLAYLSKNLSNVLHVAKDFEIDLLITSQVLIYELNIILVGIPVCIVKRSLEFIIHGRKTLEEEEPTGNWTHEMLVKEMETYRVM